MSKEKNINLAQPKRIDRKPKAIKQFGLRWTEKSMGNDIIFEGSSIDEAISLAAKELEVLEEDIQYEILEQAEKRLFGKKQLARIKVWIEANPENVLDVDIEEEVARDSEMEPEEQAYFKCPEYLSEEELDSLAD